MVEPYFTENMTQSVVWRIRGDCPVMGSILGFIYFSVYVVVSRRYTTTTRHQRHNETSSLFFFLGPSFSFCFCY